MGPNERYGYAAPFSIYFYNITESLSLCKSVNKQLYKLQAITKASTQSDTVHSSMLPHLLLLSLKLSYEAAGTKQNVNLIKYLFIKRSNVSNGRGTLRSEHKPKELGACSRAISSTACRSCVAVMGGHIMASACGGCSTITGGAISTTGAHCGCRIISMTGAPCGGGGAVKVSWWVGSAPGAPDIPAEAATAAW